MPTASTTTTHTNPTYAQLQIERSGSESNSWIGRGGIITRCIKWPLKHPYLALGGGLLIAGGASYGIYELSAAMIAGKLLQNRKSTTTTTTTTPSTLYVTNPVTTSKAATHRSSTAKPECCYSNTDNIAIPDDGGQSGAVSTINVTRKERVNQVTVTLKIWLEYDDLSFHLISPDGKSFALKTERSADGEWVCNGIPDGDGGTRCRGSKMAKPYSYSLTLDNIVPAGKWMLVVIDHNEVGECKLDSWRLEFSQ